MPDTHRRDDEGEASQTGDSTDAAEAGTKGGETAAATDVTRPSADPVFDAAFGFMKSRVVASAVEFGVFETLADDPLELEGLVDRTGVHERGAADFFDALVALELLDRQDGIYRNGPAAAAYLDPDGAASVGEFVHFAGTKIYGSWAGLDEALRTGNPQTGRPGPDPAEGNAYDVVTSEEERLGEFVDAMAGFSAVSARAIARRFPWTEYDSLCDLGTSKGAFPVEVASRHDHLSAVGLDLPHVESLFREYVAETGLADRVAFRAADFFEDPLPDADVYVLGHVLHNWDAAENRELLRRAFEHLPEDGALVVYGTMIDDERRENAAALLMSLNMLVTMEAGRGYTFAECESWLSDAGFAETRRGELPGIDSMIVAEK